jgi:hypothetical protein
MVDIVAGGTDRAERWRSDYPSRGTLRHSRAATPVLCRLLRSLLGHVPVLAAAGACRLCIFFLPYA